MLERKLTFTIVGIGNNPAKEWEQDRQIYVDDSVVTTLKRIYSANVEKQADEHPDEAHLFYSNVNVYVDKLENVKAIATELKDGDYYVYSYCG